ncbi:MAG: peptidase M28 family protein [Crocinitomicaceae bacterium]|nr:peptidase M28 family protein [Crocinitomicaceae bacterium]|tara:strand:+ start:13684 stop:15048 length:1365 start_codon:yes stop_codon:yes gene_type:complete
MKTIHAILLSLFLIPGAMAQEIQDSIFIRKIYDDALTQSPAYENLRSLCKDVGARITGSAEAEMAIYWGKKLLESYAFDTVYLQEIKVPHWERGNKESAWIVDESGNISKLDIIALGGSIGTNGVLEGEIVGVQGLDELKQLGEAALKDKVVFFNRPFDQKMINTFRAYGTCVDQRWGGAEEASKYGAKAVIIRSLAQQDDDHPHTGSMAYKMDRPIPAAAMSTNNANLLTEWLAKGKVILKMEMDCRFFADMISYNVIAESRGKDEKVITFGGHLDSWDVGEGAHDDGAGIIHSIEALRILKELDYKPNHKLRCVLFMNEENGNFGGKGYAQWCIDNKEEHICALESDRGGFLPLGFDVVGSNDQLKLVQSFKPLLADYRLYNFEKGYGGVDIGPLRKFYPNMLQLGLNPSSQRYFDFHHAESDVFENVNKRELELGGAAMATMVYLMDKYYK